MTARWFAGFRAGRAQGAGLRAPTTTSRVGERIGAYRIVGMLGTGGMGDVFKAVRDDDQYHAEVAIKLMRADVQRHHSPSSASRPSGRSSPASIIATLRGCSMAARPPAARRTSSWSW